MSEDLMASEEVSTSMAGLHCLSRLVLEETQDFGSRSVLPNVTLNFEVLNVIQTTLSTALHLFQPCPSSVLTTVVISCYVEPFSNTWGLLRKLIRILGEACPALEQLQISQTFEEAWDPATSEGIPGSALRPLRACPKLKMLSFQVLLPAFADTFIDGDIFNLPIEFNLGDEDYKELLSNWSSLETFDFDVGSVRDLTRKQSPCPRATYKTIALFMGKCPNLRNFH